MVGELLFDPPSMYSTAVDVVSWSVGIGSACTSYVSRATGPCYTPFMPDLRDMPDEPPPFLGTWRRVYTAVLIYLCVIIAAAYLFTRAFQ